MAQQDVLVCRRCVRLKTLFCFGLGVVHVTAEVWTRHLRSVCCQRNLQYHPAPRTVHTPNPSLPPILSFFFRCPFKTGIGRVRWSSYWVRWVSFSRCSQIFKRIMQCKCFADLHKHFMRKEVATENIMDLKASTVCALYWFDLEDWLCLQLSFQRQPFSRSLCVCYSLLQCAKKGSHTRN